ncbi:MAG TPA: STAS domain-containing protein [Polyangiaceae bacterium]|nr:STAS domain-containing protein [Polyangiaceae bacterium]
MTGDRQKLPDNVPFRIEALDDDRTLVTFAEFVDHRRTRELEKQLEDAIGSSRRIACDVSQSRAIDSDWMTLLDELSIDAKKSGKRLAIVGLSEELQTSADAIGLPNLKFVALLEEAWR